MKLLLYELLKLGKKKIIIALIPLLLISNCLIYVQQELKMNRAIIEHREEYTTFEAQFRNLPLEQAYIQAKENRDKLGGFQSYLAIQQANDLELARIFEADINYQQYGSLFPESEYWNNEAKLLRHTAFNYTILEHLEALIAHPEYVSQIEVQAENMLKYSIFNKPDSFSYRNIVKTPKDFAEVKKLPLQLSLDYGVVSSTQFRNTDVIMLTIVLMLSIFLFSTEREQGQLMLLRSMKRGRAQLFAAKMQALTGVTLVLSFLFYGSIMLLAHTLYGFGDGSRYIQSIGAFKFAHLPLTVHEYLISFLIGKLIIYIVLSLLVAMVILLFQHLSQSVLVLALLFSLSYMAYRFIHPASYLNGLKYINIVSFLDTSHLLTSYVNLNVWGYPVKREVVAIAVMALAFILFTLTAYVAFVRMSAQLGSGMLYVRTILVKITKLTDRSNRSVSISWHEMKKQLLSARGWIIVVVAIFVCIQDMNGAKLTMTHDQYYYNEYMKQLGGPLTEEKITFIEQEMHRLQHAGEELELIKKQYEAGDISFEHYLNAQYELEQLSLKERAFSDVYSQYRYLIKLKQTKDIDGYLVNLISSDYLFNNVNRDQINAMIATLLITLYMASGYTIDQRNQVVNLLKTTKRGKKQWFHLVWLYGLAIASVLLACIYIPQYVNTKRYYPQIDWQAPIQSLRQYGEIDMAFTLKQFTILTSISQWLSVVAISLIMLLLSHLLKKFSLTLLAGLVLVLCPTFATWLGYYEIAKYTLHYPQVLYVTLPYQQTGELVGYMVGLILFILLCYALAWKYYIDGRLWDIAFFNSKQHTVKEAELD